MKQRFGSRTLLTRRIACRLVWIIAGLIAGGPVCWPQAPSGPSAQGVLHLDGKAIPLRHAYTVEEAPELKFPDAPKGAFDLIVTDDPVTPAELECRTLLLHRVNQGSLNGVILSFDPAKKRFYKGTLVAGKRALFFSIPDSTDEHRFAPAAQANTNAVLAGRAWMPAEEMVELPGRAPFRFGYDVAVRAAVRRNGPVTATLTGTAAEQSAQARVVRAFCRAGRAGDLNGLRDALVPAQKVLLEGPEGKTLLQALRESTPDSTKLRMLKVVVRGDTAIVHVKPPAPEEVTYLKCLRDNGAWKVGLN